MNKDPLDLKWFQTYKEVCDFDDITYLKIKTEELEEQKRMFFSDSTYTPSFSYEIPVELLKDKKENLVELKEAILTEEKNDLVKKSYIDKLEEQRTKVDMLLSASSHDDDNFFIGSKNIYGVPNDKGLRLGIGTILNVAKINGVKVDAVLERLANELDVTEEDVLSDINMLEPSGLLLQATDIKKNFESSLKELDIPWDVNLSDSAQNIFVDYSAKSVVIPRERKEHESVVDGLIAHEINTHLQRHKNGLNSDLLLLSSGLAGYLSREEGLASYQELQVSQSYVPGLALYVGASVAVGISSSQPGSFSDVFSIIKSIFSIQSACTGRPDSNELENEAWKRAVRIYRGINDVGTGKCFTRDISYWKGYLKVREQIKEGALITDLLKGKF